jgi:hypothetical protein
VSRTKKSTSLHHYYLAIKAVSPSKLSALKERLAGIKGLARDAHKMQLSEHVVQAAAIGEAEFS